MFSVQYVQYLCFYCVLNSKKSFSFLVICGCLKMFLWWANVERCTSIAGIMVSFIWNKQKHLNENERYTKVFKTAFMFVTNIVSYDGLQCSFNETVILSIRFHSDRMAYIFFTKYKRWTRLFQTAILCFHQFPTIIINIRDWITGFFRCF